MDAQRAVYEQGPLPPHPEHRAGSGCAAKCRACLPGMDKSREKDLKRVDGGAEGH
jgi:hypothetical protein